MNKRKDIRYLTEDIDVENVGQIKEISKNGLKIRTHENYDVTDQVVKTNIDVYPIAASPAWRDKTTVGFKFKGSQDIGRFIKEKLKKINEDETPLPKTLSAEKISLYSQKDILTPLVHLMAELESANTDLKRLGQYIADIHEFHKKTLELWQKEKQKLEKEETDSADREIKVKVFPDLKDILFRKAFANVDSSNIKSDVDNIINRLGLQSVKQISSQFIKNNRPDISNLFPKFRNYQTFDALKTVLINKLSRLLGFQLDITECISILSLEPCGFNIVIQHSGRDMTGYYSSAGRIYSDEMRRFEQLLVGLDYLLVSKIYFEKVAGIFRGTYDGYILGHIFLNPSYRLNPAVKIQLTKNKLEFGFLSYLIFLAARYVYDNDRESGYILISKLRRAGLMGAKAVDFVNNCILEANRVVSDLGVSGNIPQVSSPSPTFSLERYLPQHPQYDFFLKGFKDLDSNRTKRLAVTYEDQTYAHLIIDKIINSNSFNFSGGVHCVVPCENMSEHDLYLDSFSNFDLIIFKNVDKLPRFHHRAFAKLWETFEGKIIVTINSYGMFDFENIELYNLMKGQVINFPSYAGSNILYKKMIDHLERQLKPFTGLDIDKNCYADNLYTMEHIRTSELQLVLYQ